MHTIVVFYCLAFIGTKTYPINAKRGVNPKSVNHVCPGEIPGTTEIFFGDFGCSWLVEGEFDEVVNKINGVLA